MFIRRQDGLRWSREGRLPKGIGDAKSDITKTDKIFKSREGRLPKGIGDKMVAIRRITQQKPCPERGDCRKALVTGI